ncbi:MAG TPA: beta-ketoacyl synthase N-terminal-like domain-containing protein, partial [Candidatus Saccharimonadales bacterium]|nr:beta-ketoacyl synthase N-terminal-like domain-containing protein [Candidatus Saccharimonadales bacterium]
MQPRISRPPSRSHSRPATFVDLLADRAERQPDRLAFTFLLDGELETEGLTFGALDGRVRALAALLQDRGVVRERVLLLAPPGLDYVVATFACLAAGAVAVPAYPPRPGRTARALEAIVADSTARFAIVAGGSARATERAGLSGVTAIDLDDADPAAADQWRRPRLRADQLALLQYTSGSTGTPRGAMMSHGQLVSSSAAIASALGTTSESTGVSWLPPYHDMGLFGAILQPVFAGAHSTLMAPLAFLQRPMRWLEAISRLKAQANGAPNFAYELLVENSRPEERAKLDLSHWAIAPSGAEPIRPETIDRFSEAFADSGFRRSAFFACYGLAESLLVSASAPAKAIGWLTVDAEALGHDDVRPVEREDAARPEDAPSTSIPTASPAVTIASCGRPIAGLRVEIVDPERRVVLPLGRVGEVWVSGERVVRSYWRRPAESRRLLRATLAGGSDEFLRTGDLGFFHDGELYITGRRKELVIIRGRNHYPLDIERTVEAAHPDIRRGGVAAFGLEIDHEERLGIVAEVSRRSRVDPSAIIAAIRRAVAEDHELGVQQIALVGEGRLPRTSSGKTQRGSVASQARAGTLSATATWTAGRNAPVSAVDPAIGFDPDSASPAPASSAAANQTADAASAGATAGRGRSAGRGATADRGGPSARVIEAWLVNHIAERLGHDPASVERTAPFLDFGLGSVEATALAGELATWLDRPLSPTLTWEYPTIERLARFLAEGEAATADEFVAAPQEPIAIVGIGVRFPGAPDIDAFRELLRNGRDAIRVTPADRWDIDEFYDPNPATPGKIVNRNGGFLETVDRFDPQFFGISPREAGRMDPQQRLLLEVTEEALEHAAIPPGRIAGTQTGVFIGIGAFEYTLDQAAVGAPSTGIDVYTGTGNAHSIAANRISFLYDLRGPSLALDTACSSSLVAIHMACQSLLAHESDAALAGGVNLMLSPMFSIALSQGRMLSPSGLCQSFDAAADGYVRSEGAGIVVLKRLSDARRDGDRILALIRGSAVNQDGLTSGITAPSGRAQQDVMRTALARAGIAATDLGAIEAHGTGTPLGDPIEANALAEVLGQAGDDAPTIWLSSVKANVGHLEVASGMAGLAKVMLELAHSEIYPQIHFNELNPRIRIEGTPLRIPTRVEPWPIGPRPRFAGISSFGFGGTNAHLVIEEAREPIVPRTHLERPLHLVTVTAKSEAALRELARLTADALEQDASLAVEDVAWTANTGRGRHLHRAAVLAATREQLRERMALLAEGRSRPEIVVGKRAMQPPPIVFLYTGQGAQYRGMGRTLYETQPTFRAALDRCAQLLEGQMDRPLLSVLFADGDDPDLLAETVYTQPALFALEYAMTELWRSWGVEPDAVAGHSVGEYVAACVAGALSLEDATRLIAARGRLMHALPRGGAMVAVLAPLERVEAALDGQDAVSIAGINGPENITISGAAEAVDAIVSALGTHGISAVPLTVSHAFHSPLMDPILDEFEVLAGTVEHHPLRIALATNLTGQLLGPGATLDARYWRDQARNAVRFADDIRALHDYGAQIFLEVGPNP